MECTFLDLLCFFGFARCLRRVDGLFFHHLEDIPGLEASDPEFSRLEEYSR